MEHTALTVRLPATVSASKVRTPAGRMATANVCQTCGRVQGRLRALALPADTTSPAQHSGLRGQRAPAAGTDAAGHPLVTVGTPNPAAGAATGPDPVLAGAAGGPVPAPGERTRAPTTAATPASRATPAAASSSVTVRRRRAGTGGWVPAGPGSYGMPNEAGATACPVRGVECAGVRGAGRAGGARRAGESGFAGGAEAAGGTEAAGELGCARGAGDMEGVEVH